MTVILDGEQHWVCPNCTEQAVSSGMPNRYHHCRGLAGLYAPMVLEGTRARIRAVEWDDYVHDELVRRDGNGRPVSAVITERPDGSNDCAVFPSTARLRIGA